MREPSKREGETGHVSGGREGNFRMGMISLVRWKVKASDL